MKALKMVCIGMAVAAMLPHAAHAGSTPAAGEASIEWVARAVGTPVDGGTKAAASPIVPGVRVRVSVPSELYWSLSDRRYRLVGSVASIGDGRLMLGYENRETPLEIPFESVRRIEISRGSRGGSPLKGAGIGFLVGAGFGFVLGIADGDDEGGLFSMSAEEKAVTAALGVGMAGLFVGLIGGLLSGGEQWETIPDPFPDVDVTVSPQGRSLSVAVTEGF